MQGVQTTDGNMHAPPEVASRIAALPPLIKAAMDGNQALVRQLVAAGADIAQPNQVGLTCAHFAAKKWTHRDAPSSGAFGSIWVLLH